MLFLSIADACRLLGIDPKTLHRWLAQAHLALQAHPGDARKHGLSEDHLRQLARLHQRSLAALPSAEPAPPVPAAWPPPLLALPTTLAALQAQITALQQQVAMLSQLLQQHTQPPATPAAPTPQTTTATQTSQPAPPASSTRRMTSAAKTPPHKPIHVNPRVEWRSEGRYVVICPKKGLLPLEPDTPAWFAWLAEQSSFRFVGKAGHFSAHHEWRTPNGAWRAHRHIRNQGYSLRLAPSHELTIAVLEQVATTLQAYLN